MFEKARTPCIQVPPGILLGSDHMYVSTEEEPPQSINSNVPCVYVSRDPKCVSSRVTPRMVGLDTDRNTAGRPPSAMLLTEKATIDKPGGLLLLVIHQGAWEKKNRSEISCNVKGSGGPTRPMAARSSHRASVCV